MGKSILKYNFFGFNVLVLLGIFSIPVTLIFNIKLNVIAIILLSIGVIWHYFKSQKLNDKRMFSKLDLLYLFSFFMIQLIGLIYSTNFTKGIKEIETKFAFFIFPLLFILLFRGKRTPKKLIYFVILTLGISLIVTFYFYLIPNWFFYSDMTLNSLNGLIPNELAHVYFSLFGVFSFISFFYFYRNSKTKNEKVMLFVGMILLFIIPVILTARVASFLSLLFLCLIIVFDKQNRMLFSTLFISFIIVFSVWGVTSPEKIKRFKNIFISDKVYNPIYHRKNNIECAFSIFLDNPLIGAGTGSVQELLNECYFERKYWGLKRRFNTHNEYLAELARHGVIGFFAIAFLFCFPLHIAFKERNYLYIGFLFIIMVSSLTENIFSRQVGVVFFSFFNTLFYFSLNKKINE
jgi:O-antigen ligase